MFADVHTRARPNLPVLMALTSTAGLSTGMSWQNEGNNISTKKLFLFTIQDAEDFDMEEKKSKLNLNRVDMPKQPEYIRRRNFIEVAQRLLHIKLYSYRINLYAEKS